MSRSTHYYTADVQMFGMFNFNGVPQKTFYAFRAFWPLLDDYALGSALATGLSRTPIA